YLFRFPIVRLAFQRGAFDRLSTWGVCGVLPWILMGAIPMASSVILMKALFASEQVKAAAWLGTTEFVLYFCLSGFLNNFYAERGIAMAFTASWWLTFLLLCFTIWGEHVKELFRSENIVFFA